MKRYFGEFGGMFVPETFIPVLKEIEKEFEQAMNDDSFKNELNDLLKDYVGRPSPIYFASNLSKEIGANVYLKREDLNHTGAHKINNTLGQALLARKIGKNRLVAETGAGQHGVATATAAAVLGLDCTVYMGYEDIKRQKLNVYRMELLGAEVIEVEAGSGTLKDAINEAFRDWIASVKNTYYLIGSVVGPHPYPTMVREFQSVIGRETKKQIMEKEERLPDYLVACVGGGSNSIGLFYPFLNDDVKMIAVEAGGRGTGKGEHAFTLGMGKIGVLHGSKSLLLNDENGQIDPVHSISAGLDYPGVGPELAYLKESGRMEVYSATDKEVLKAFKKLTELEGILPALESAHAIAYLLENKDRFNEEEIIVVNLSGRGDKDIDILIKGEQI